MIPKHPPFDPLYRLPFRNSTWVGWSQNDTDGRIDIRFDFDHQRLFDHVEVFGFGTRPVRQVEVEFSGDGTSFGHKVVSRYPEDLSQNKEAEVPPKHYSIKIPLNQRGQTIKMKLEFEEDWLYLSEIRFGTGNLCLRIITTILSSLCRWFFHSPGLQFNQRGLWHLLYFSCW